MKPYRLCCGVFLVTVASIMSSCAQSKVQLGADVLIEKHLDLLAGKRVGLITNHTGRLSDGRLLKDVLLEKRVEVVALFAPEHGLLGKTGAGEEVGDDRDSAGIPVYSLYGSTKKPTVEMLHSIDLLIYDIQDVGVRFYTYISTMGLAMEAAAEQRIPFVVLDRPNPLGGLRVEGPLMEDSLKSFLGLYPIPVVYGLTCGELALMIVGEGWLGSSVKPEVIVIAMEGWKRKMAWGETGLAWIPPSPNIPDAATALCYPATCYIEATNLSEGRGTGEPFRLIGAPFIDGESLAKSLESLAIPGVTFEASTFTPVSSKHKGSLCGGVRMRITNPASYQAVDTGLKLLQEIRRIYPDDVLVESSFLLRLLGSGSVVHSLLETSDQADTGATLGDLEVFREKSLAYLLYP